MPDQEFFRKNAKTILIGKTLEQANRIAFDNMCEILVRKPGIVLLDSVIQNRCNIEIDENNIVTNVICFR